MEDILFYVSDLVQDVAALTAQRLYTNETHWPSYAKTNFPLRKFCGKNLASLTEPGRPVIPGPRQSARD